MLQLLNICKSYNTGGFVQTALDDVSISFRDNEFVAILGPSGSGKTTLLNIIGGLDHYDSGNLVIDGISTEEYTDRDWDTYRNNRIGFVFQSYNLIPHQTVLSNVELALTLSGVEPAERRERAIKVLEQVGLGEHLDKKPSQMSGGQMQRVAIARALINDPEILLADEPTGALDSKTSVQIMDLLTEIAKDRLVIMVTHNPELAEEYATRIVNLVDGTIQSDSNLFVPDASDERQSDKPVRRTSMSFLTALSLSFNNLMTKKGRTLMTAFAGSIGIIGIAAILALANGVNNYINSVEEETLSEYPLQIMNTGFDMSSMMSVEMGVAESDEEGDSDNENSAKDGEVSVTEILSSFASSVDSNDLPSLKKYLDSDESDIDTYVKDIEYTYDITPQLFLSDSKNIRQVHPDKSFSSLGIGSTSTSFNPMSSAMSTDQFYQMPDNSDLYENQYEVKAGRWPEKYNEIVLVLAGDGSITDFMLYTLGLRDSDELDDMVKKLANEEKFEAPTNLDPCSYDEILGVEFKLVNASDWYQYDSGYGTWRDKSGNNTFMRKLVADGEDVSIVGIVQPKEDASATMLMPGLGYTAELTSHVADQAAESKIVKEQLKNPSINVFTGKKFGEEDDSAEFNMDSLFTINTQALQEAFVIDESKLALDMSDSLDLSTMSANLPDAPAPDVKAILSQMGITVTDAQVSSMVNNVTSAYAAWLGDTSFPTTASEFQSSFAEFLGSPAGQSAIAKEAATFAQQSGLDEEKINSALQGYVENTLSAYMGVLSQSLQEQITASMEQSMQQMGLNMASAISIDSTAFANAFQMNMDPDDLSELMLSMVTAEDANYENNLKKLGYIDEESPSGINIYPINFESKERVVDILDDYNDQMKAEGDEDKVITYTDYVGVLMSSVTTIVDMITTVLVAFVAISLVVSSIMIGIITYISVLERKKEIGILRSIGASKRDIARVFNAETLIVGFVAGVIGVGLTALMCIPVNIIVDAALGVESIAVLPFKYAVILVVISMFLTFVAGLIPSRAASRKDPVEALRSE